MNELPETTDVLIVGAGPTGLALAAVLCDAGVDCCVVDAVAEGGNYSRAVGTLPRTLEMLQQLKVAERMVEASNHAQRIRIFSGDRDRNIATLHLRRLDTEFPFAVLQPQHATEEILLTRLGELGGVVLRPLRVTALRQSNHEVVVTVADAGGDERTVRAKYVVGADGTRSDVRKMIGVEFAGETFRQRFLLGDLELGDGSPADEIQLFFSRAGGVIMGHMPGKLHRVCISVDEVPAKLTAGTAEALLRERAPARKHIEVRQVVTDSHTRVHHRVAARFRLGRVFLAGDAAHVNSPIIGQGMNLGIQDGITLGNELVRTLRTGADTLDAYERIRRPIALDAVGITQRINDAGTQRSSWRSAVRDLVLPLSVIPGVNRAMITRLSRLVDR
jgi:2-polyprenyl-6-methoxyphenol hydroxylase-like FAD-dependent oxidoreductase